MQVNAKENVLTVRGDPKAREKAAGTATKPKATSDRVKYTAPANKLSLQEQMLQDALQAGASSAGSTLLDAQVGSKSSNSVNLANIVRKMPQEESSTVFDMETKYADNASKIMELS